MEQRISHIIETEDKKNPLTDEEIAAALHILRELVTTFRKEKQIPDSRERRKPVIFQDMKMILSEYPNISERQLTKQLTERGYKIGKYAVGSLKEELLKSWKPQNQKAAEASTEKEISVFSKFIGYNGSMKNQISRAQAAILYPPNGLHCLIYGPSGVGKSFLAELMHQYAVTTDNFNENAPFFEFNCADYADNPQLLLAQLFGYAKGAFTGAVDNKKGIVELCDGGILFLDEVHRLPPEGQEILFYLMDKGKFRRMGESDIQRESRVMVIAATTENPQSSLLLTFRRRIPMIIEIPPMKERPVEEKSQFIHWFFSRESRRLGKKIKVKQDVIKCLLGGEYQGNVGQLKSDIQVCCAKAFLDSKVKETEKIVVRIDCLAEALKKDYHKNLISTEVDKEVTEDLYLFPEEADTKSREEVLEEWEFYEDLEERYTQLKYLGIDELEIEARLSQEIEERFVQHIIEVRESRFSEEEIANIVGTEILHITRDIYHMAKEQMPQLEDTVIFPLAIHLGMAIERMKTRENYVRPGMKNIKELYPEDYEIASLIMKEIQKKYYISLNEEEVGFLTMYLQKFQKKSLEQGSKISVLVVSHGSVASGMAKVANAIMGVEHAVGLDMDLKETPVQMAEKVVRVVSQIEDGKGCIILADMGSLLSVGEKVREELGIPVGVVGRTDTLMVVEAIRKTMWTEESIEEIVEELTSKRGGTQKEKHGDKIREKAILCLCITGEGAAKKLKKHLMDRLSSNLNQVHILTRGYIENSDIRRMVNMIEKEYEILAIIGTIDPQLEGFPFLSLTKIYQPQGIGELRKLLKRKTLYDSNQLKEVIKKELIFVNHGTTYKDCLLDEAIGRMIEKGYVNQEFLLSVYKREGTMTTFLNGGIAIPHGDTRLVTKPVISVTKLDTPIVWDGTNLVDLIFILALDENSKQYFEQLYRIISDEYLISSIRQSISSEEIYEILCKNTKSVK